MDNFDYLFVKARENGKVAKALSEKLQTEVDKNNLIEAINGIDVETIVNSLFIKNGLEMIDITSNDSELKDYAYQQRIDIKSISLPNALTVGTGAFRTCVSLQNVSMLNVVTFKSGSFYKCISLRSIYLPSVTEISVRLFSWCCSLKSVVIANNQICTLSDVNAFEYTPIAKATGYIYVPDELVEDYKVATNWSVYADKIRPMSEYVEEK